MLVFKAELDWNEKDTVDKGDTVWVLLPERNPRHFDDKVVREGRVLEKHMAEHSFDAHHISIMVLNHDGCVDPNEEPHTDVPWIPAHAHASKFAEELKDTQEKLAELRQLEVTAHTHSIMDIGKAKAYDSLMEAIGNNGGLNVTVHIPEPHQKPVTGWFRRSKS